ncbi:hypothetical protein [Runella aurantiaca]|uniref:Uncharacterized protein n=1 Tax=Runella aurantiaca TaxID=2282308 RepID=A0A369IAI7_9BACT|nr:hypothetical protein [Runella aurantiaca]RDB05880.1 hypothetical protein DVG78_10725 [Runella aurantiaca]
MKKVLLTGALLLTFAFSYAGEVGEEKEKSNQTVFSEVENKSTSVPAEDPAFECFGLSCGTVCGTWSGTPTAEEVVDMWYQLEDAYCGG